MSAESWARERVAYWQEIAADHYAFARYYVERGLLDQAKYEQFTARHAYDRAILEIPNVPLIRLF